MHACIFVLPCVCVSVRFVCCFICGTHVCGSLGSDAMRFPLLPPAQAASEAHVTELSEDHRREKELLERENLSLHLELRSARDAEAAAKAREQEIVKHAEAIAAVLVRACV
jgi:hypothetical protein